MSDDLPGSLCTTNAVRALIEELQFTLGEGPCLDAYHHNQVVLEPTWLTPAPSAGWHSRPKHSRSGWGRCSGSRCGSARPAGVPSTSTRNDLAP
jgi:hypothetical protein